MKLALTTLLLFITNILLSQVNTFPYEESFEQTFTSGSNISFIPNWTGNKVATRNRIFAGSDARTGNTSLNIIPTSSFSGEVLITLDFSGINNPKLTFYAYSKQNGSASSTRPTILRFATSIDGGSTYLDDVQIGTDATFPNDNITSYTQYGYELPLAATGKSNVVVRIAASRGNGSGSAAELVMDDFRIEAQVRPLAISSTSTPNASSLVITFNQEVTQTTAELATNYAINNGVRVISATRTTSNEVTLATSNMSNNNYLLTVNSVEDAATNTPATNLIHDFSFVVPLSISTLSVTDKNTIEVDFNLDVEETTAETVTNYNLDNAMGNPQSAIRDTSEPSKVILKYATDLTGNTFNLTVNNVTDLSTLTTASNLVSQFSYLPLEVSNIVVNSATEIQITFNQIIESASAITASNYSIDYGIGTPLHIAQDTDNQAIVTLILATAMVNNTYTVTISNLTNLSGNATAFGLHTPISHVTATRAHDIVINEIFADPTGANQPDPVVLPNATNDEFVELFNTTNKAIDISGFDLSGGTIGNHILNAGAYVILTATSNVSDFQAFGDVVGVSSWNTLTNGGEELVLRDNLANLVDSVTYRPGWHNDNGKSDGGWSLEQINPFRACSGQDNWSSSTHSAGGTPGLQNNIFNDTPDAMAPNVIDVIINSDEEVMVVFDEIMDALSLSTANYTLNNGLSVDAATPNVPSLRSVTLTLTSPIVAGTIYDLSITNATDCAGNTINTSVNFSQGAMPVFQELIITEIMATPEPTQGLPEVEYLEVYNASDKVLSLNGVILTDATRSTTLGAFDLKPGEYLILTPNSTSGQFLDFGNVLGVNNWPTLNKNSDQVALYNVLQAEIHRVNYNESWFGGSTKAEGGFSLEMIDPDYPCLEEINWTGSGSSTGGTPGGINSADGHNPDLTGPEIIQAIAIDASTIQMDFNEKLNPTSVDLSDFSANHGLSFIALRIGENGHSVLLTTAIDLVENTIYTVFADNLTDCTGNLISSSGNQIDVIVAAPAITLDILINEVLFNPRTGGVRFVEIYNNSNKYINLKDWKIAGPSNSKIISSENLFMAPSDFLTITSDGTILLSQYPKALANSFIELSSMPSLPTSQGSVFLIDNGDEQIDSFDYDESYHSPLLNDVRGVSLERISFSGGSNDPNNWFSAASTENFATPGYGNSQSSIPTVQTGRIIVEPQTFAPDIPGGSDFTTLSYAFDTPGNILNVKIIDAEGNIIKHITQNAMVGTKGFLTWDGTTNEGGKARMGYYMVLMEVISSNGRVSYLRNKVAIGTRF